MFSGGGGWSYDEMFQETLTETMKKFSDQLEPHQLYVDPGARDSILHMPTAEVLKEVERRKKPSLAAVRKFGANVAQEKHSKSDGEVAIDMGTALTRELHGLCKNVLGGIEAELMPLCREFYAAVAGIEFKLEA
eukprot:COSAG04_NODE_1102_length_8251_cov_3.245339_6_plen_134_part_00